MGMIELKKGNTQAAKKHFEEALAIEPENGWVKYELLPELNN
jgi:Tfp pilus assembly protein PilF